MKEGFKRAIEEGKNFYGPSEGIKDLREAVVQRETEKNAAKINYEDVLITNGISEGLI